MDNPAPRPGWCLALRRRSTPAAPTLPFASQSPFRRRPPSSARRADRRRCFTSIHVRALAARASRCFLIGGIDGTYTRTAVAARIKVARVVIGISDAVEKSSRSAGLTLLVARKGAVAETRKLIALNAKGITASDGPGRRGAKHGQSARRQHGQNCITHESLLIDSLKQPKPSAWVPVNSRSWGFDAPLASNVISWKIVAGVSWFDRKSTSQGGDALLACSW